MSSNETFGAWLVFACTCALVALPFFMSRGVEDTKARKFWRSAHAGIVLLLLIGYLMQ